MKMYKFFVAFGANSLKGNSEWLMTSLVLSVNKLKAAWVQNSGQFQWVHLGMGPHHGGNSAWSLPVTSQGLTLHAYKKETGTDCRGIGLLLPPTWSLWILLSHPQAFRQPLLIDCCCYRTWNEIHFPSWTRWFVWSFWTYSIFWFSQILVSHLSKAIYKHVVSSDE